MKRYLLVFCIVPINEKYYSENVDIVPIIGYTTVWSEVQNYVHDSETGSREVGYFR